MRKNARGNLSDRAWNRTSRRGALIPAAIRTTRPPGISDRGNTGPVTSALRTRPPVQFGGGGGLSTLRLNKGSRYGRSGRSPRVAHGAVTMLTLIGRYPQWKLLEVDVTCAQASHGWARLGATELGCPKTGAGLLAVGRWVESGCSPDRAFQARSFYGMFHAARVSETIARPTSTVLSLIAPQQPPRRAASAADVSRETVKAAGYGAHRRLLVCPVEIRLNFATSRLPTLGSTEVYVANPARRTTLIGDSPAGVCGTMMAHLGTAPRRWSQGDLRPAKSVLGRSSARASFAARLARRCLPFGRWACDHRA